MVSAHPSLEPTVCKRTYNENRGDASSGRLGRMARPNSQQQLDTSHLDDDHTVDDKKSEMTLRTLNYGNYGIVLIMGNAGFISSTVVSHLKSGLH